MKEKIIKTLKAFGYNSNGNIFIDVDGNLFLDCDFKDFSISVKVIKNKAKCKINAPSFNGGLDDALEFNNKFQNMFALASFFENLYFKNFEI